MFKLKSILGFVAHNYELFSQNKFHLQKSRWSSRIRIMSSLPPQQGKFLLRRANKDDIPCVHSMIKELASFENISDGPKLSEADLIRDSGLNGDKEFCHIYVMEQQTPEKQLAGYSICCFTYSTWEGKMYFLEDLFLRPEYRNKGVGELMFRQIAAIAHDYGCKRVEFHVLNFNPARRFYARMGAIDLTETEKWHYYRLKETQIEKLAADHKKSQCD